MIESKEESHQGDGIMDDNAPRYLGACEWFNALKGFGFLRQDGSGEQIFVHQSELQMKGFRSLENGSRVSFSTRPGKKGIEAYNVRGEADGDELTGSSFVPFVPLVRRRIVSSCAGIVVDTGTTWLQSVARYRLTIRCGHRIILWAIALSVQISRKEWHNN